MYDLCRGKGEASPNRRKYSLWGSTLPERPGQGDPLDCPRVIGPVSSFLPLSNRRPCAQLRHSILADIVAKIFRLFPATERNRSDSLRTAIPSERDAQTSSALSSHRRPCPSLGREKSIAAFGAAKTKDRRLGLVHRRPHISAVQCLPLFKSADRPPRLSCPPQLAESRRRGSGPSAAAGRASR